jgi:hypothetical protein
VPTASLALQFQIFRAPPDTGGLRKSTHAPHGLNPAACAGC